MTMSRALYVLKSGSWVDRPGTPNRGDHLILQRLKRILWPMRPVLLPIWRRVRPFVQSPRLRRHGITRPAGPLAPLVRKPGESIRPLRKNEFDAVASRYPYYRSRWDYMSVACRIAGELIERYDLQSALELGPHVRPVIVGADVMDRSANVELRSEGRVIIHDATAAPWPIADGHYGLFVGLQVFEHLADMQNMAFREVCRVARHAIISLPIDWEMDDPKNVHHRISREKALSWFEPMTPTRIEVGNGGPRKRMIYVFENLDAALVRDVSPAN